MYYRELLRVRRAFVITLLVIAAVIALQVISNISEHGGPMRVNIDLGTSGGHHVPLSLLFAVAGFVTMIFAGIVGSSLCCENSGHLDLAWTKPASRSRYALTTMAVDLAAIAATFVVALAAILLILYLAGGVHLVSRDSDAIRNLARYLVLPVAWFGLVQTLTASLRDAGRLVAGLVWIPAFVFLGLAAASLPPLWSAIVHFVNFFNPMAYAAYVVDVPQPSYPFATWELNLVGLAAIGILGVAAAVLQWRRLEI